jgi:protocatechuate 3,4-dioxygenase beta subunit
MMKTASLTLRAVVALIVVITTTAVPAMQRADFALTPATASISGEVRQQGSNDPLAGIIVYAISVADLEDQADTVTNAQGRYTLEDLPPGNYYVATPGGSGVTPAGAQDFAGEYYPGTFDSAAATVISLAQGATETGIDFTLGSGRSITGTVQAQVGGSAQPVPFGLVLAVPTGADEPDFEWWLEGSYSAPTLFDGSYTLGGLPATSYYVYTYAIGSPYADEIYPDSYTEAGAQAVDVTAGDAAGIDFLLDQGAVIEGRVTGADNGAPLEGVSVGFSRQDALNSSLSFLLDYTYRVGFTDDDGNYRVQGLPPGSYLGRLDVANSPLPQYANELYPGVYETAQATAIVLTPGQARPGVDFSAEIGGIITGQVQRADNGQPMEGISIFTGTDRVLDIDELIGFLGVRETVTDENGEYRLEGLPPFDYVLLATPELYYDPQYSSTPFVNQYFSGQFYDGVYATQAATTIPVALGATTNGIDFALPIGEVLGGLVTRDDTGDPLADVEIETWYTDLPSIDFDQLYEQYYLDYLLSMSGYVETGADGTYEMIGLRPGPVSVEAFKTGFLPEYYDDRQDPNLADTVQLGLGGISTGSVSGRVTDLADGTPLSGLQVSLYDSGSNDLVDTTMTDASGNYTVAHLFPGDYKAMADGGDLYRSAFYDDASDIASADRITIADGSDVVAIDFSLLAANGAALSELLTPILNLLLSGD